MGFYYGFAYTDLMIRVYLLTEVFIVTSVNGNNNSNRNCHLYYKLTESSSPTTDNDKPEWRCGVKCLSLNNFVPWLGHKESALEFSTMVGTIYRAII